MTVPIDPDIILLNYGSLGAIVYFLLRERSQFNEKVITQISKIAVIIDERVPKQEK